MEKIGRYLTVLFFLLLLGGNIKAQKVDIVRSGLIKTQLTISPAYLFSSHQSNFYLHGNFEGYLSSKISIAGEAYFSLGTISSDTSIFEFNHGIFFGASRHFTIKNSDFYIGLQPGISFTKLNKEKYNLLTTQIGVNPLFSPIIGYNFFVNKVFHFFLQTRLVVGSHNYNIGQNLTEFRFSAGLGLNLNTLKAK